MKASGGEFDALTEMEAQDRAMNDAMVFTGKIYLLRVGTLCV